MALAIRLTIVWLLPDPGGPSIAIFWPEAAFTSDKYWDESASMTIRGTSASASGLSISSSVKGLKVGSFPAESVPENKWVSVSKLEKSMFSGLRSL